MKPKKIYDFKNDVLFKYLLANDKDPDSYYLLKLIIEQICNIHCEKITVKNPELNPQVIEDKEMILDIRVEDDRNRIINVEMQNSYLSIQQYQRFQIYGGRILVDQEEIGDSYLNVHPVYQIIFIDDIDKDNQRLIDTYQSRNKQGWVEKACLTTRIYVYLPYINYIKKEKGIRAFSELERTVYIFKNGIDNAIMGIEEGAVKIMKEKAEHFNQDKELREMAFKRELNRRTIAREARAMYEEGEKRGEGRAKYEAVLRLFKHNFPDSNTEFSVGLTIEQYDLIFNMLLDGKSIEEIKEMII